MNYAILLTCEHAGCTVPGMLKKLFLDKRDLLMSHRGWDPYAWEIARNVQRVVGAPLLKCRISRLVVEVNRSLGHPRLWSEFTRDLPERKKAELLRTVYHRHRDAVRKAVERAPGPVAHLGIHTFTPVLGGKRRDFDVGLLFDPKRRREVRFCRHLRKGLAAALPDLRIRFNAPYKGASDGLTTTLRKTFPPAKYLGIEVEVSQAMPAPGRRAFARALGHCLAA